MVHLFSKKRKMWEKMKGVEVYHMIHVLRNQKVNMRRIANLLCIKEAHA